MRNEGETRCLDSMQFDTRGIPAAAIHCHGQLGAQVSILYCCCFFSVCVVVCVFFFFVCVCVFFLSVFFFYDSYPVFQHCKYFLLVFHFRNVIVSFVYL